LTALCDVDSFWPRRVVDSALRGYDPEDDEQEMSFKLIRESPVLLASDRPDLDPLSDRYERPMMALRRPTMDDDHADLGDPDPSAAAPTASPSSVPVKPVAFAGPVDGFADDYLPSVDDEYGPAFPVAANELAHGDLVDVSVDGVCQWKYVHAEPYLTDDVEGVDRLVIPYRDLDDSRDAGDIDVDPYEVMQARRLHMS
jgi:hypothetical protein